MGEGDEDVGEDDGGVGVDRRHTMMAPAVFRRHRGREGESPPSSSLTFYLDGRRVSPLVLGLHGTGGARAPPRLDLSLCLSLFLRSRFCPFTVSFITEIRNSDWAEFWTRSLSGN